MDLNKLTKKELLEYGESLEISLNIRDTKESLITKIERYEYTKCDGCKAKVTDAQFPPDGYEDIYYIDDPSHRGPSVSLCEVCFNEWSDVPKGFKLEINKSNGGLWYRPLSKKEKSAVRTDKLFDSGFMIGWWIKGSIIVLTILAIAQFF